MEQLVYVCFFNRVHIILKYIICIYIYIDPQNGPTNDKETPVSGGKIMGSLGVLSKLGGENDCIDFLSIFLFHLKENVSK